jgi:hypothetical protein
MSREISAVHKTTSKYIKRHLIFIHIPAHRKLPVCAELTRTQTGFRCPGERITIQRPIQPVTN